MLLRSATRAAAAALLMCLVVLLAGCSTDTGTGGTAGAGTTTRPPASSGTGYGPTATVPGWASGRATVAAGRLPAEARNTLALIDRGGPYPYPKDGAVFSNFERELPREKSGYYHEYTVTTPGSRDRGARRIITGDGGEFYYTDDHYKTFKAVLR